MTSVVTMNSSAVLQQIMGFRTRIGPSRQDYVMNMKKIDSLLNPAEVISSNWRSGANFQHSGNSIKKNGSNQSALNSKWKNSNSSLSSTGGDTPKNESSPHQKYESKFKNSETPVEKTILNTIILNKLNKFSASTYTEIRDFLYQILDSGETDFTKEFMRMVFKKAAAEEIFCPLYAKLLSELRITYPVIQTEMADLFHCYLMIFQDMKHLSESDYKTFVAKNSEKKYRMGYSQFLAELVILEAVDSKSLEETFLILIENVQRDGKDENQREEIHEYADCLVRTSKVFHKKNTPFFITLRKNLMQKVEPSLTHIIQSPKEEYPGISAKARFALMDVCDNLKGV
jgi:hypothetical protein